MLFGSTSKEGFVAVPPLLLQTLVAGPLLQNLVAGLSVEYVVFNRHVAGSACRKTHRFCYKPCRKKAARACYKPDGFEALPYVYIYVYTRTHSFFSLLVLKVQAFQHTPAGFECRNFEDATRCLRSGRR